MKEGDPDFESFSDEIEQTQEWKELVEAVAEVARSDAIAYMKNFFHQNKDIPVQPGYRVPEEIIKQAADKLSAEVGSGMPDAEYKVYREAFLAECELGYPVRIN